MMLSGGELFPAQAGVIRLSLAPLLPSSSVKKDSGVMIKPYTISSVKVYVATDRQHERLIRGATMDIFDFSDSDFSRFTFNTLDTPQVKPFNTKVKKFIVLQLIFENDAINEGFGVYSAECSIR